MHKKVLIVGVVFGLTSVLFYSHEESEYLDPDTSEALRKTKFYGVEWSRSWQPPIVKTNHPKSSLELMAFVSSKKTTLFSVCYSDGYAGTLKSVFETIATAHELTGIDTNSYADRAVELYRERKFDQLRPLCTEIAEKAYGTK